MFRLEFPPYAYIENDEYIGSEVGFMYAFTNLYGYKVNMTQAFTIQDQIDCLKNKTIDIAGGLLPILDEYRNDVAFSNPFHPTTSGMIIRYGNHIDFGNSIYDSIKDFNGETLGTLHIYSELTKSFFPDSKIIYKDNFYELYIELLAERVEALILDKVIADYFNNRYPQKVSFYSDELEKNNYGFGFQKNEEGEILRNQFNEFLKKIDRDALYEKWLRTNSLQLHVNKTLNESSEKTINYATLLDLNPTNFLEFGESKGYELDLIYMFAREYNYKINFINLDLNESNRINYLLNGSANITGGHFTINDERKEIIHFSDIILESSTLVSCRLDSKKENLTTHIVDQNYEIKPNNNVDIEVKFSNITKNASCVFPVKYNDTIIINCTIYNMTEKNPFYEGFKYGNTTDKIRFFYYDFEANNFFKANTILSDKNILTESDKSKVICTIDDDKKNSTNSNQIFIKQKSSKLSTGAIIGIIIPCVVALLLVTSIVIYQRQKMPIVNLQNNSIMNLKLQNSQIPLQKIKY
jgi:polar amino acid transport system substrate-binding protein